MGRISDVNSIIVPAQSANLSEHVYNTIYAGTGGCSVVINGVSVNMAASSSVDIKIKTISGGVGCFLLGEKLNVVLGSPTVY